MFFIPKDVSYGGDKPDSEVEEKAKGKNGNSTINNLFSQINDFFFEFGLINRNNEDNQSEGNQDGDQHQQYNEHHEENQQKNSGDG